MSPRTAARAAIVAFAALAAAAPPAPAEDPPPAPPAPAPAARREAGILLRNATVLTMAGDPIPEGGVLIREGKIASVGRALPAPDGATVHDCTGRFIVPGFIDAGTQVGLVDIDLVRAANDSDDGSEPSTPDLDVRDGINVESALWGITRSHGVTTVLVAPQGTNVVNGRGAILHCLDSVSIAEKTVLAPSGLHVSFGGPSKARFAEKDKLPATRMGVASVLRAELSKAQEYREKRRRWEEKRAAKKEGEEDPDPPATDPRMEALSKALAREIPVFARAERLDDIRTALRLGEEFNLRVVLFGATESWKIARELAEKKVPVVLGPVVAQPDSPERPGARMDAARLLQESGVLFCLMSGDAHNARNLPYHAGIAASWGLPENEAIASITRNAARVLGLQETLGTIESGKEATLCVFQGSPLEPLSRLERMYIRGVQVPLRNRQTDLHEKWK